MDASAGGGPPAADARPRFGDRLGLAVRDTLTLHVRRPAIWVAAAGGAALIHVITGFELGPRGIAMLLAPPPLDAQADLLLTGSRPLLAAVVAARVLLMSVLVAMITGGRPVARRLVRMGGAYLGAYLATAVPLLISFIYVGSLQSTPAPAIGGIQLLLLFFNPLLHVVLVALVAPLAIQAGAGLPLQPRLGDGVVWAFAAVSVWVWIFFTRGIERQFGLDASTGAYVAALLILGLQSLSLGGIAAAVGRPAGERP